MRAETLGKFPRYFPFSFKITGKEKIGEKVEIFFPERSRENFEKLPIFSRGKKKYIIT
jgi:hypothetical protein